MSYLELKIFFREFLVTSQEKKQRKSLDWSLRAQKREGGVLKV